MSRNNSKYDNCNNCKNGLKYVHKILGEARQLMLEAQQYNSEAEGLQNQVNMLLQNSLDNCKAASELYMKARMYLVKYCECSNCDCGNQGSKECTKLAEELAMLFVEGIQQAYLNNYLGEQLGEGISTVTDTDEKFTEVFNEYVQCIHGNNCGC